MTRGLPFLATTAAQMAMRKAEHLRRDKNHERRCRKRAEQRTQRCLSQTHIKRYWNWPAIGNTRLLHEDNTPRPAKYLKQFFQTGAGNDNSNSQFMSKFGAKALPFTQAR